MAIIQPYADPSAHGKVTPGLAFIRRGNKVSFGANRRPRNKNTVAQQTQRAKISQAVEKYRQLNFEEKIFLRRRGSMISKNQYNLFVSSQLKGQDWSKIKGHQMQTVDNMVIFDLQQDDPSDMNFSLISSVSPEMISKIKLWSRLDSETAGVITSDVGPDIDWTGTPSHPIVKFINGAYSNNVANCITTDDSGEVFGAIANKHMFGVWIKTDYDVTNGIPADEGNHTIFDWRGVNGPGGPNITDIWFQRFGGLFMRRVVNGVTTNFNTSHSAITFNAGDLVYLAFIYDRDGIDGGSITQKTYFGNEAGVTEVLSSTDTPAEQTAVSQNLIFLRDGIGTGSFIGSLDNIKLEGDATFNLFNEKLANRNNVGYEAVLGSVLDNSNIFTPGVEVASVPELRIKIENFSVNDWRVPFYWALAITWSNQSITERTTLIRFPKTIFISSETGVLYLSTDLSSYFDQQLFRLGATDNI